MGEAPSCTWTRSCAEPDGPVLRHVRARLPAQRAGDLLPARRRRRGRRAARRRLGGPASQVVALARGGRATRGGGGAAAEEAAEVLRRRHRRLSGPRGLARGKTDCARTARDLQPPRLAARDAGRRSRPIHARLGRGQAPSPRRPARPSRRRPRRRGHRAERPASCRTRRAPGGAAGRVLRRRGGTRLPAGLAQAG